VYNATGNFIQVRADFTKALQIDPNHEKAQVAQAALALLAIMGY
jgi:Tfp pilus assembly protein PilF